MLTALQVFGVVSIFILVASNVEAHFENKSKAKDAEYYKHVIESLFMANK